MSACQTADCKKERRRLLAERADLRKQGVNFEKKEMLKNISRHLNHARKAKMERENGVGC